MDTGTDRWSQRTAFVGFDWASDHHDVALVDQRGKIVEDFRFDDTAEGWQLLIKKLSKYPDAAVAIETSSGATVERLLEAGYAVYPINPKAAKRYRERKAPSGTKTDHLDAWSLADALRLDGHTWRPLMPNDPVTAELRLLCRDEIALIEQRTALICQLRAALSQYYPIVLRAFDELAGGDPQRAAQRVALVKGFPLLDVDEEVERVARFYVDNLAMPRRDLRDAFHLALASVHEIEYLVTWNFAHLANASKRTHIEVLNRRLHLISPVICSPEELMLEPLD